MIHRTAAETLRSLSRGFPVVGVVGPRQSGKTTLARAVFDYLPYVSLENPDVREFARTDPRGFLSQYRGGAVFDEVQRAPGILSYLQQIVDESKALGRFILTGSQQYNLRADIAQSLAGRVGSVTLLPFSVAELGNAGLMPIERDQLILQGLYPPVYDRPVEPRVWYENYVSSYVERDVRQVLAVKDLNRFQSFVRLCAGRTGQILNLSNLGDDAGVSHNTAREWIAVLEAAFLVHRLHPYYRSFSKRLIKTPKLYFTDPGLAAWLLGIHTVEQLASHPLRGALFETFIVGELLKSRLNAAQSASLYFWRERGGFEIDAVIEEGPWLHPVEIKSGSTATNDMSRSLRRWPEIAGEAAGRATLVYGGDEEQKRSDYDLRPWHDPLPDVLRSR